MSEQTHEDFLATNESEALCLWERLGHSGLCVSIVFGPSGNAILWSVNVLRDETGEEFDKPFAAASMRHAVKIACVEARKRGWIDW